MNIAAKSAKALLKLLQKMDNGYKPNPKQWRYLRAINAIDFSAQNLTRLPNSISCLSSLTTLDVSNNQLSDLPETITQLPKLTQLRISDNQFVQLPACIKNLPKLFDLSISNNDFIELPDWLGTLQHLAFLDLTKTGLKSVPEWIRMLTRLRYLAIGKNPFKTLPEWLSEISSLSIIWLEKVQLTAIPASFLKLDIPFFTNVPQITSNIKGIFLLDSELSIQPISLFDQSRDTSSNYQESRKLIQDYFTAPKTPIREAKVIFLGDGKTGKTYTIKRMLNGCKKGEYQTKETHGILIEDLRTTKDGKDYKVRVWDFGGQDIMHEMHRCFLTDRTCYVVMVDTRTDGQTGRARYWLRTVNSVAPSAPVLLFVNEISGGKNRDLDYQTLKNEFPNLVDVQYCSARDANEDEFRQKVESAIFKQALSLDSCIMEFPESWEHVRQHLLDQKGSTTYYIDRDAFHTLCDCYGVSKDNGLRTWLLTWLNDLGVCFSYHLGEDGREQQIDYKILDPMWLTSAVYKIIWEKEQTDDGLISLSEVYRILEQRGSKAMKEDGIPCLEDVSYDKKECGYVLDIMRMFRISYPADNYTEFIPTLCKPDSILDPTPEHWRQRAAYEFRYTFLPESVLHRLMIYCFANLRRSRRWRKGFWLECEPQGLSAVIRTTSRYSEENVLRIEVYAQTEEYDAWLWLQPLCQQVMLINDTLSLKPDTYILAEKGDQSEWIKLDKIWRLKSRGVSTLQGDTEDFDIDALLTLVYGRHYYRVEKMHSTTEQQLQHSIQSAMLPKAITAGVVKIGGIDMSKPFIEGLHHLSDALNANTSALEQNTQIIQTCQNLLLSIANGTITLPSKLSDALEAYLEQSEALLIQEPENKTKWYSGVDLKDKLWSLIGKSADLATIATVIAPWFITHQSELELIIRKNLGI